MDAREVAVARGRWSRMKDATVEELTPRNSANAFYHTAMMQKDYTNILIQPSREVNFASAIKLAEYVRRRNMS